MDQTRHTPQARFRLKEVYAPSECSQRNFTLTHDTSTYGEIRLEMCPLSLVLPQRAASDEPAKCKHEANQEDDELQQTEPWVWILLELVLGSESFAPCNLGFPSFYLLSLQSSLLFLFDLPFSVPGQEHRSGGHPEA